MKVKQNPKAIYTELEDKIIILEAEKGELLTLNDTASFIWKKCRRVVEVEELVDKLCQEFKVERKVATKDTQELVKNLLKRNLLVKA